MPIPQFHNLLLRPADKQRIPLATVSLLILPPQQDRHDGVHTSGVEHEPQHDGVAHRVPRRVLGQVDVRGDHAREVGQHEEHPLPRRPLVVRRQVVRHPGDRHPDGDVQSDGDDDAPGVLSSGAVLPCPQQDGVARAGDQTRHDGKDPALADPIGEVGRDAVHDRPAGIARDREQLRLHPGIPQRLDDRGQKRRVPVQHDRHAELAQREHPDFPVPQGLEDLVPLDLLAAIERRLVEVAPDARQLFLSGREILRRVGVVGKDHERRDSQQDRRDALDDHQPAPGTPPANAVHMADGIPQEPAAGPGDRSGREEQEDAQPELAAPVEEGEVERDSGKIARLARAQQQPQGDELRLGVDEAGAHAHRAPADGCRGDEVPGADGLEEHGHRQLEGDVGGEQQGDADLVVVTLESEVGLEMEQARVA